MLLVGNDNLIRLLSCADKRGGPSSTPVPITNATVNAEIKDATGTLVGSSIPLLPIPGSDGDYEGVAASTLALVDNAWYVIEVTATDGPGRMGFWSVNTLATVRHDV